MLCSCTLRSWTGMIVAMRAIPFEAGDHEPDDRNSHVRTREIDRDDVLNADRAQALELPPNVGCHVIGIEAWDVAEGAGVCGLRHGVDQGRAQFLLPGLRIIGRREIIA